jgi:hypothetical protein
MPSGKGVIVVPKSSSGGARSEEDIPKKLPPARTRERRTGQLVNLAEDLVEERLRKGTASPTEVTAVLRLGTAVEQANIERIKAHTEYLKAQRAKAESETVREEMFKEAMAAMSRYQGDRSA